MPAAPCPKSGLQRKLQILALMLFTLTYSVCGSIRYGFLVDAFSRRNLTGKLFGAMESSLFIGFVFMYLAGGTEFAMRKFNNFRTLFAVNLLGHAALTLATGLIYLVRDNNIMVIISIIVRILQGVFAFSSCLLPVDFAHAIFPEQFDFVNGLGLVGNFVGHGVAGSIGCLLYDNFGYLAPFIFSCGLTSSVACLVLVVMPPSETFLSQEMAVILETAPKQRNSKLSKMLVFPMISTMLISANYGVFQVSLTPFLHEEFGKSITYGGTVLIFASLGMAIGSLVAGAALQKKILNHYTLMILGALLVLMGLMLSFPPKFITPVYKLTPYLAFVGTLLAGVGDPVITVSTLRALYTLQEERMGRSSPALVTRITGTWLVGYCAFYFSGPFISGFLDDYFSYSNSALILAGLCVVSASISLMMRLLPSKSCNSDERRSLLENYDQDSSHEYESDYAP